MKTTMFMRLKTILMMNLGPENQIHAMLLNKISLISKVTTKENYEERTSGDHQIAIKRSMVDKRGHYKNIRCNCRICGAKINSFCEKCNIPLCQKIYGEDKNCFKEFHESRTLGATKRKYNYY